MPTAVAQQNAQYRVLKDLWDEAMEDRSVYLWGKDLPGNLHFDGFAFTQDEHDPENPIKHLPDRPHLRHMSSLYDVSQKLVCFKSRQVMLSWLFCSIILHECLKPGRRWLVSCKKEEDANKLLLRMKTQYSQLPVFLRPPLKPKHTELRIIHPNGVDSVISAAAENSDDPRSETYSGIWVDESSFTSNLPDFLAAGGPTTMAGGKMILTTTPNGRDYGYELLTDKGRLEF